MKLTYGEQLQRAYNKACKAPDPNSTWKTGDKAAMLYYSTLEDTSACVSWERFRGSWAYTEWLKKWSDFL